MKLYCYCTYKFSPVGFAIGYIDIPIECSREFTELEPCRNDFVKRIFETGVIRGVYGKNPLNNYYYFMVKKLKCEFTNKDNISAHKVGNFVFEFTENELDKYEQLLMNFKKEELVFAMNRFIIPDSSAKEFALKIHTRELNKYIKTIMPGTQLLQKHFECSYLHLETQSAEPEDIAEISEIIGCPVYEDGENKFTTQKKTLMHSIISIAEVLKTKILEVVHWVVGIFKK